MRKSSVNSVRQSQAGSFSSQSSTGHLNVNAKLEEKKKEHDALLALERLSQEYVRRLEAIDLDCNVMADAGKVHGEVLSQWPEMFRILSLSVPGPSAPTNSQEGVAQDTASQVCERLVRVPVDELQQRQNGKS